MNTKLLKKLLSIILAFTLISSSSLYINAAAVHSQTVVGEDYAVKLDIMPQKEEYEWGETVVFDVTATNRTEKTLYGVEILTLAKHFKWFTLAADSEVEKMTLKPQESVSFTVSYESEEFSWIVSTIFMPLMMLFSLLSRSEYSTTNFNVEESVKVGWFSYKFGFFIEYNNLSLDLEDCIYDKTTDKYYLFDEKNILSGAIFDYSEVVKATYSISDCNGKEFFSGNIGVAGSWQTPEIGLIVGENFITVTLEYSDGTVEVNEFIVNNLNESNMASMPVDLGDSDSDGVLNFIEELYHTDSQNSDSDSDGLTDYDEMAVFGTDPLNSDSDDDGISDSLEDIDEDGLTNYDELYVYDTNPIVIDTDGDVLTDFEEVAVHNSSPVETDTDADMAGDFWEVDYGFDPTVADEDFGGLSPSGDPGAFGSSEAVSITVILDDPFLNESTPGYMGSVPCYIDLGENESAEIVAEYDVNKFGEDADPALFYFNEETQEYEEVPTTITEDGKAVATVGKPGKYILLNRRYVADVWENDILAPTGGSGSVENESMDIVFVIDRSASMDSNDPDRLRIEVVKKFVEKMRDEDRAAIVQFTAVAETIMPITNDKVALINAADSIQNSDGGGCFGSDSTAGTNGAAGIDNALAELEGSTASNKYIIFLTDGDDTVEDNPIKYADLEKRALESGVVIHSIGLVGTGNVNVEILQEIAKETNGNYYLATTGSSAEDVPEDVAGLEDVYKDIEKITIDRHLDSNEDGISDYYTELMCNGELKTSSGGFVFGTATFEEVQSNADYDGDGLLNGEEVVVTEGTRGVYAKINSYPYLVDTDGDSIGDYSEVKDYGISALKPNSYVDYSSVKSIVDNDIFAGTEYWNRYNKSMIERGSVWVGNAFFGTTLDQTYIYQEQLVKFFEKITESREELNEKLNNAEFVEKTEFGIFQWFIDNMKNAKDNEDFQEKKDGLINFLTVTKEIIKPDDDDELFNHYTDWLMNLASKDDFDDLENYAVFMHNNLIEQSNLKKLDGWNGKSTQSAIEKLVKEFDSAKTRYDKVADKINIRIEKFDKIMKGVSLAFEVYSYAECAAESFVEYTRLLANLETVNENIEILECIINMSGDNRYLRDAALNIKHYLATIKNDDISTLEKYAETVGSYVMPLVSMGFCEFVHEQIGKVVICGVPVGAIIELARTIGNLAGLDKLAEAASQTVANASMADAISKFYVNQLGYVDENKEIHCINNAVTDGTYIVAYSDFSEKLCLYLIDLALIRIAEEKSMQEMNKDNEYWVSYTNQTMEACEAVKKTASERYILYKNAVK